MGCLCCGERAVVEETENALEGSEIREQGTAEHVPSDQQCWVHHERERVDDLIQNPAHEGDVPLDAVLHVGQHLVEFVRPVNVENSQDAEEAAYLLNCLKQAQLLFEDVVVIPLLEPLEKLDHGLQDSLEPVAEFLDVRREPQNTFLDVVVPHVQQKVADGLE